MAKKRRSVERTIALIANLEAKIERRVRKQPKIDLAVRVAAAPQRSSKKRSSQRRP